jgi:5-methylcytosine-specific restriction endonuclease McrA
MEDPEIRDIVEMHDQGHDIIDRGDTVECVKYWDILKNGRPFLASTVYGIHRINDTDARKAKKEVSVRQLARATEERRVKTQLRRAESLGNEATLTTHEWLRIVDAFLGECAYCSSDKGISMDHVIPVSLGGGTTRLNVVPCCFMCNCTKGNRSADALIGVNALEDIIARLESIDHD